MSRFMKLTVLLGFLFLNDSTIAQEKYPALIVSEGDTFVIFNNSQYNAIEFSFSYIRELEKRDTTSSKEINKLDSITNHLERVNALERAKLSQMDSIQDNYEEIIKKHKKQMKREKLKQTLIYIFGGAVIAGETGLLLYTLTK